jgi:hypothetical protein
MMKNIHAINALPQPGLPMSTATLTGVAGQVYWVNVADASYQVRRAASCLIQPEIGDTVLVYWGANAQTHFILSVLVHHNKQAAELVIPGGVTLQSIQGDLQVQARDISLQPKRALLVNSPVIKLATLFTDVKSNFFRGRFTTVESHVTKLRLFADNARTTINRLVIKAKNYLQTVDGMHETRAGRVRTTVASSYGVKARHASIDAEGAVRIDGEKIDLG